MKFQPGAVPDHFFVSPGSIVFHQLQELAGQYCRVHPVGVPGFSRIEF
jgi:hypothetical protein